MTLRSYWVHLSIGVILFVALLFTAANEILGLGFFGRAARVVSAVILGAFLIYGIFFMPTRQEVRVYVDGRRKSRMNQASPP